MSVHAGVLGDLKRAGNPIKDLVMHCVRAQNCCAWVDIQYLWALDTGHAPVCYNREEEPEFTTKLWGPWKYVSLQSHTQTSVCLWLYEQDMLILVMYWKILIGLAALAHFQISHETGLADPGNSYLKVLLKSWWAKLLPCSDWKWRTSWHPLDEPKLTGKFPAVAGCSIAGHMGRIGEIEWKCSAGALPVKKWNNRGGKKSSWWLSHERFLWAEQFSVEAEKNPVHFFGIVSPSSSLTSLLWHKAVGCCQTAATCQLSAAP